MNSSSSNTRVVLTRRFHTRTFMRCCFALAPASLPGLGILNLAPLRSLTNIFAVLCNSQSTCIISPPPALQSMASLHACTTITDYLGGRYSFHKNCAQPCMSSLKVREDVFMETLRRNTRRFGLHDESLRLAAQTHALVNILLADSALQQTGKTHTAPAVGEGAFANNRVPLTSLYALFTSGLCQRTPWPLLYVFYFLPM